MQSTRTIGVFIAAALAAACGSSGADGHASASNAIVTGTRTTAYPFTVKLYVIPADVEVDPSAPPPPPIEDGMAGGAEEPAGPQCIGTHFVVEGERCCLDSNRELCCDPSDEECQRNALILGGLRDSMCTGALIAPNVVLTAAHCKTDALVEIARPNPGGASPDLARVRSWAVYDEEHPFVMENDQRSQIEVLTQSYDVALAILEEPIALDSYPSVSDGSGDGRDLVAIGSVEDLWPSSPEYNDNEFYESNAFRASLQPAESHYLNAVSRVTQPGDSGGPIVERGGAMIFAVTTGEFQAQRDVFARTDELKAWIDEVVSSSGE